MRDVLFTIQMEKIMNLKNFFVVGSVGLLATITGCNQSSDQKIDQENLCQVNSWELDVVSKTCKPGQKVVYLPASFGNEQLPIIFAAVNCDLRFNVALTRGAVTCIFQPIKPSTPQQESSKDTPPVKP